MIRWFRRRSLPLVLRLALTLLLITGIAMSLLTAASFLSVRNYEVQRRIGNLAQEADFYAAFAEQLIAGNGNLLAVTPILVQRSVGQGDTAVRVFGSAGQLFGGSGSSAPFPSRSASQLLPTRVPLLLVSEAADRRYAARAITWQDRVVGVVEVSQTTEEELRLELLLRRAFGQATIIATLAAIIGAIIVARWLARLISGLRVAAANIAAGDLKARAVERGPHEFVVLTQAVNTMADQLAERLARIEEQSAAQQRFYRDVSHELRTPLMALGGYLENIEDAPPGAEQERALQSMQREVARLGRLADELLRAESAPQLQIGPLEALDLGAQIGETIANLQGRAQRGGVSLRAELPPSPVLVAGDRDRLKQALLNLLDNALRSTPPGGAILVQLAAGDPVTIDVRDTGPGIPPELQTAVWQRGVRGADGGSGLGLAIVRSVLEAHHGQALLLPSAHGAHFQLQLPPLAAQPTMQA